MDSRGLTKTPKLDSRVAQIFLINGTRKLILFSLLIFVLSFGLSFMILKMYGPQPAQYQSQDDFPSLVQFLYNEDNRHIEVKEIIEYTPEDPIDAFRFYHDHLSFGMPFIIRGFMNDWPAFKEWQDDEYLLSKIGNEVIEVEARKGRGTEFAYFQKEYARINITYKEFLEKYKREDLPEKYYWAEQQLPPLLEKDLGDIEFANFLNLEEINVWQGAVGTISLPHTDARDNFLCQISGYKELIIIPPTQTAKLYIKPSDDWPGNYSPIDFYNPDYKKYPDFKDVNMKYHVKINAGDIIYLPSFWWHHIRSSKGKNIAINYWFTNNFMVDLLMTYIQS